MSISGSVRETVYFKKCHCYYHSKTRPKQECYLFNTTGHVVYYYVVTIFSVLFLWIKFEYLYLYICIIFTLVSKIKLGNSITTFAFHFVWDTKWKDRENQWYCITLTCKQTHDNSSIYRPGIAYLTYKKKGEKEKSLLPSCVCQCTITFQQHWTSPKPTHLQWANTDLIAVSKKVCDLSLYNRNAVCIPS